jgi:hypothetical protein
LALLGARSTPPSDIAVNMLHLRSFALIGALTVALSSVSAADLSSYAVVKLHPGLNNLDLAFGDSFLSVIIGHRENFNAHGFEVVSFYLSNGDPSKGLDILGLWDKDKEALTITVSGGADCLLHDFRLLRSRAAGPPMLVVADRPPLASFVDNAPVSFGFYELKQSTAGLPGKVPYWFDLVETRTSKAAYCDVGVAFSRELGLGDYRTAPRPDGYQNSPGAVSDSRWRGR